MVPYSPPTLQTLDPQRSSPNYPPLSVSCMVSCTRLSKVRRPDRMLRSYTFDLNLPFKAPLEPISSFRPWVSSCPCGACAAMGIPTFLPKASFSFPCFLHSSSQLCPSLVPFWVWPGIVSRSPIQPQGTMWPRRVHCKAP